MTDYDYARMELWGWSTNKSRIALRRSLKVHVLDDEPAWGLPIYASEDEMDAAYLDQRGMCKLCYRQGEICGLAADHCHETGRFRGWLCSACNSLILPFFDSPLRSFKISTYPVRRSKIQAILDMPFKLEHIREYLHG